MCGAKVEIAFWRYVGNIGCYPSLFAQFPYLCGGFGVVDGCEYHVYVVKVRGYELPVDVSDSAGIYAMGNFEVQAVSWADYCDSCVCIQDINYATGCNLELKLVGCFVTENWL